MKNKNSKHSVCGGGCSAKGCTLIKAFLFWNSNRKRWKHQLLVWFSAPAPSKGSLNHVALSIANSCKFNHVFLLFFLNRGSTHSAVTSLQNNWGVTSERRFSNSKRGILKQEEKLHVRWSSASWLLMKILIYNNPLERFHLISRFTEDHANFQSVKSDSSFLYQKIKQIFVLYSAPTEGSCTYLEITLQGMENLE